MTEWLIANAIVGTLLAVGLVTGFLAESVYLREGVGWKSVATCVTALVILIAFCMLYVAGVLMGYSDFPSFVNSAVFVAILILIARDVAQVSKVISRTVRERRSQGA